MKKNSIKNRVLTTLLASVLVFNLTACGEENSGTDTSRTADNQATAEVSHEGETDITMVLDWTPNTNHTGLYVAEEKGYFEEAGLHVTIVQPPDGGAEQMVASGDAQFGIGFQDTLAPALTAADPLPISAVAAILQHNTSGIVSLVESGIDDFGKMPGHTYATWDSPTEQAILKTLVEEDGGKWEDVKLISTYVEDVEAGLHADIDCVWVYAGWEGVKLEMDGISTNLLLFKDTDPIFDYYNPVVIGNNTYMSENADVTQAFINAIKKGYEYASENPDEAADILLAAAPELDEALVKKSQAYLSTQYIDDAVSWGVIDPQRWNGFYKWLNENKLVEKDLQENAGLWDKHL